MSTSLVPVTRAQLLEGAVNNAAYDAQAELDCGQPFFMARCRTKLLQQVRQFFSTGVVMSFDNTTPDTPAAPCLKYDADPSKATLRVEPAFSANPPGSEQPCVYVRVTNLTFEKLAIASDGGSTPSLHKDTRVKGFSGTATFTADHAQPDIAVMLLDHLLTYLEGTKHQWLTHLGLMSFDVTSLKDADLLQAAPQQVMRSVMTAEFRGRLNISAFTVSLPLKRISLQTTIMGT